MTSLWSTDTPARLPLTPGKRHDVAVIGAGLTGLVTALLLARAGRDVVVLESRRVGAGTTGATTGKVSLLQGIRAQRIARMHDVRTLRHYLDANRAGQQWLLDYCASRGIAVQRHAAITYAGSEQETATVRDEYDITRAAGLPTEFIDTVETPFPSFGAVRLADQAQFDPMSVLIALAADVEANAAPIHETTPVRGVGRGTDGDHVIHTGQGELRARTVVLATGTPILDRGGFFARLTAQRSYLAAFRVEESLPPDMLISAGSPTRSLRTAPSEQGTLLLVGGNGHEVGREERTDRLADDLVEWTERWFPSAEPVARWSAQDYAPVAELPYVGPLLPGHERILVATGFAKWGLTNGVAAALALAGRLEGTAPEWAATFTTWRPPALRVMRAYASANTAVLQQLSGGWLAAARDGGPAGEPAEGCGYVRRSGLRPVAVSTVDGVTNQVSAICPHLYGIVGWNAAEKSWDCPLHGSRFAADGTLIEGPATESLTRKDATHSSAGLPIERDS
ncbi:FAD-dependent oxidoreductase [Nocardia arizonensis]|uniref:FAD-dependent oxidoreductase n=1 Tax=Nocardia arizonensis TaxID=1141647 RepID=UPI0006D21C1E|nr:FAD-dependent oxidoreductase [Nocardia arizonensis]